MRAEYASDLVGKNADAEYRYCHSILINDGDERRVISSGDVIVVRSDDKAVSQKFAVDIEGLEDWGLWRVGRVILCRCGKREKKFEVVVQWYLPFAYLKQQKRIDNKTIANNHRSNFMLVQTRDFEAVEVDDILPGIVAFKDSRVFKEDKQAAQPTANNCMLIEFHCHYKLEEGDDLKAIDPGVYFSSSEGAPPKCLVEAWCSLPNAKLREALAKGYSLPKEKDPRSRSAEKKLGSKRKAAGPLQSSTKSTPAEKSKNRKVVSAEKVQPSKVSKKRKPLHDTSQAPRKKTKHDDSSVQQLTRVGKVCYSHCTKDLILHFSTYVENRSSTRIAVGDLLALKTDHAKAKRRVVRNKSLWFPFDRPWSAGQVIAIYRKQRLPKDGPQDPRVYLQIRWLNRVEELPDEVMRNTQKELGAKLTRPPRALSGRILVETDEQVTEITSTGTVLGRISITSDEPDAAFLEAYKAVDKLPQLPMVCRHFYCMRDYTGQEGLSVIRPNRGWSNYTTDSQAFLRGMASPKGWPGKLKDLCLEYARDLDDPADIMNCADAPDSVFYWPVELLSTVTGSGSGSKTVNGRRYFSSLQLSSSAKRKVARATGKKSASQTTRSWRVKVSDVVAVAADCAASDKEDEDWSPFVGPWKIGQVLCLSCRDGGEFEMEIRWYLRKDDLDGGVCGWMPPAEEFGEVYESDSVDVAVPVSRVLGSVRINDAKKQRDTCKATSFRCNYFYFTKHHRFQSLEYSGSSWVRSVEVSKTLRSSPSIREFGATTVETREYEPFDDTDIDPLQCCDSESGNQYYPATFISPHWSKLQHADVVCCKSMRQKLRWLVRVGDVVAIEISEGGSEGTNFPFSVPWKPAQILSICEQGEMVATVAWFDRNTGEQTQRLSGGALGVISSSDSVECGILLRDRALGPVTLVPARPRDTAHFADFSIWANMTAFLPHALYKYVGHYDGSERRKVNPPLLRLLVEKQLRALGGVDVKELAEALRSLSTQLASGARAFQVQLHGFIQSFGKEIYSPSDSRPARKATAWVANDPFYIDHASGIEYFHELAVAPPQGAYAISSNKSKNNLWTLRLGDVVALHCGQCAGRAKYRHHESNWHENGANQKYFPFLVPWAVAEIVAIQREHSDPEPKLEIRWFYRVSEIPGAGSKERGDAEECEELFESDVYDEIAPSSLLAPVALHGSQCAFEVGRMQGSMPHVEFFCQRFWSAERSSLLPVKGLDGRIARGQARAPSFRGSGIVEAYRTRIGEADTSAEEEPAAGQWTDTFDRIIHQFTLTTAFEEALHSKDSLLGRTKEIAVIKSFLSGAIQGKFNGEMKPSIFLAGPPGTGKTSSVHAVVNELSKEKLNGRSHDFQFVTLNGMEMRNPNQAYTAFWDKLRQPSCPASLAARKLDAFFEGRGGKGNRRQSVVVLLLDEIDYLMSKSQSVIHNFFHWPVRALETKSKNRLIVIAVSNTMNLPDRLHPRVRSRMGPLRVDFRAYNSKETADIIESKVKRAATEYDPFERNALIFASKKTAAISGDIRKAFLFCKKAAETVRDRERRQGGSDRPVITMHDMLQVTKESMDSASSKAVATCSTFETLFLVAAAALSKTTGREFGGFDIEQICARMGSMARALGETEYLPPPSITETLGIVHRLAASKLITIEAHLCDVGGSNTWPLAMPTVDPTSIHQALSGTRHKKLSAKYLSNNGV